MGGKTSMAPKHWTQDLPDGVCDKAVAWAKTQPTYETAWANCERGDWMLWLAGYLSGAPGGEGRKPLVLAACACARLNLPAAASGEIGPLYAIETAEAWARGEATLDEVRTAAATACTHAPAAAHAAATAYAVYAIYADAAAAAYAPYATAIYALYAIYATYPARIPRHVTSGTLAHCADIVRTFYPEPPALEGQGGSSCNPKVGEGAT